MERFIGDIELFSFNFAPPGWALCNGQTLPITQNQALFSLLSFNYGGDGRNTFGLPNLQTASPNPAMNYYMATTGYYPPRPY